MKQTRWWACVLGIAVLAPAFSEERPIELQASSSPAGQVRMVRESLDTEEYAGISERDRHLVLDLLDRIEAEVGAGSVESLSDDRKVRLFNWQDQANAILSGAREDSRMVCRREKNVGTRFAATRCATVAERRRMRAAAQQELRQVSRPPQLRE